MTSNAIACRLVTECVHGVIADFSHSDLKREFTEEVQQRYLIHIHKDLKSIDISNNFINLASIVTLLHMQSRIEIVVADFLQMDLTNLKSFEFIIEIILKSGANYISLQNNKFQYEHAKILFSFLLSHPATLSHIKVLDLRENLFDISNFRLSTLIQLIQKNSPNLKILLPTYKYSNLEKIKYKLPKCLRFF